MISCGRSICWRGKLCVVVPRTLEEALLRCGILVLRGGLRRGGTFEELMEKKGYFHALYTMAR